VQANLRSGPAAARWRREALFGRSRAVHEDSEEGEEEVAEVVPVLELVRLRMSYSTWRGD
jgi:hypothetical protein